MCAHPSGDTPLTGLARLAEAARRGDTTTLRRLLTPDVVALCDTGGTIEALTDPIHGPENVSTLLTALLTVHPDTRQTIEDVNGHPGLVVRSAGRAVGVIATPTPGARIGTLWIVLNPAKLGRWHDEGYGESRTVSRPAWHSACPRPGR